ncbi:MAG: hypothetical protein KDD60_07355 [Bdellovibrionales bacterium]|nr:hypothetical protein [Bdellovibrionales bacterium]
MRNDDKNSAIYTAHEEHQAFDPTEPERNLQRAILLSALSDIQKGGSAAEEAKLFFLNEDDDYIFSFRTICYFLELDPTQVLRISGLERLAPLGKKSDLSSSNQFIVGKGKYTQPK